MIIFVSIFSILSTQTILAIFKVMNKITASISAIVDFKRVYAFISLYALR